MTVDPISEGDRLSFRVPTGIVSRADQLLGVLEGCKNRSDVLRIALHYGLVHLEREVRTRKQLGLGGEYAPDPAIDR
jgi:hypothetical protein